MPKTTSKAEAQGQSIQCASDKSFVISTTLRASNVVCREILESYLVNGLPLICMTSQQIHPESD